MNDVGEMGMGELAAYVCTHLKDNGIDVVLSGGGCVALYSDGAYVSYDLDFVENMTSQRRHLRAVLSAIGFMEKGRYFKHPDTRFFLEFPAGPLSIGSEPPKELTIKTFETGVLTLLSATDCIKDRLAGYFFWNDLQCLEQALLIAQMNPINLDEIERWAANEGMVKKLEEFSTKLTNNS